jgi:hypothetical protein
MRGQASPGKKTQEKVQSFEGMISTPKSKTFRNDFFSDLKALRQRRILFNGFCMMGISIYHPPPREIPVK